MADQDAPLTGTQRAAVVLLSLGEAQAAEVLKHMEAKEVQKLGVAMASVGDIPHSLVQQVIARFVDTLEQPAKIGDGADEYVRAVLMQALGEERASGLIDRILSGRNTPGLEALKWMEPKAIAQLVRNEHPQIIAIVMAHLEGDQAAEVLKHIPAELHGDLLVRIATLDGIPPHALAELNDVMARQFSGSQGKPSAIGGAKVAANILNFVEAGQDESLLKAIAAVDDGLGTEIRDLMFVFDNLANLDDRTMQAILREVSTDKLALAMRGADVRVREKITKNMSQRAAEILLDDMEARGPVRLAEVEAAQKDILDQVRKMAEAGDISISTRSEALV
ncbi:flagellar motor switch protein FliG [Pseudoxanthomonas winnipegensis]|jgi:flagellar motor switch protein FliG|uniref:Flagellar motor switch protein FliG n=1 Tax=Pseudoxanthomonas winnipegensis TaxID=2480810 RepID=A0A4Q8M707_9GAMM|nr:flagellar motor switch protein FliG [Pseudoxanthomonas winnipegensis]MDR6140395.1 flagellar motor switch protein FliG [Pseudoxanthomonas sp. SORGH_AS_0997]MDQ1133358.1 flagellar motor switch protein FliG [Pseudoxanthomonas winnipegensis]RZZ80947.1 flagellar motor switch protein FliG [Pseudoxanthomonas winnipegensis]RZZ89313.1 flagellar motor switch protein FliG [Pseudoxanthomonas winnipegensis]